MDADRFEKLEIVAEDELWRWLEVNGDQAQSVWLVTWKAARRDRYVSREAVLDALVAHGWIDGRRMKLDGERTMQLISPRRQQAWAQTYRRRAARLEGEGRMHPRGQSAIERAQAAGLWEAMPEVDALQEPDDLAEALAHRGAKSWWDQAAPSYRRNVLRWIASAKRPATRAKRVEVVVDHASRGQKVSQY